MKKSILVLLLLTGFFSGAHSVNQTVANQYKAYTQLIIDRKIEQALDYANPEMVKMVPREQMAATMQTIFENPQLDLKSLRPTVSHFEPVKKINEKNYVRFKSHTYVDLKYVPDPKEVKPPKTK